MQKYVLISAYLCLLLILRLIFKPENFADYEVYHSIVAKLMGSSVDSLFEWLSYKTFQEVGDFFGDPSSATYYVYFLNSIIFSIVMFFVVKHEDVNYGGILIALAIFSPLLYFVTLRATPAYLLILCSILLLDKEKKKLSLILLLAAIFYHVSAIIPAFIIFALTINHAWVGGKSKYIALAVYFISTIQIISFILDYNLIPSWLSNELNSLEYLEKYSSYADISLNYSTNHYIYLSIVLVLFYILRKF
jgi:hypothetical protein